MKYRFSVTTDKLWSNTQKEITNGNDMYAFSTAYMVLPKVILPQFVTIRTTIAWKHIPSKSEYLGELTSLPIPLRVLEY